jgi:hypothetical protein
MSKARDGQTEANHFSSRPQTDLGSEAGTVGEGEVRGVRERESRGDKFQNIIWDSVLEAS